MFMSFFRKRYLPSPVFARPTGRLQRLSLSVCAHPFEANRSSVVFKYRAAKIPAYITQMNGFNPRSSSDASFAATERARGSIRVPTNPHQVLKLVGRILALQDFHFVALVLQAIRQAVGIFLDFERANLGMALSSRAPGEELLFEMPNTAEEHSAIAASRSARLLAFACSEPNSRDAPRD